MDTRSRALGKLRALVDRGRIHEKYGGILEHFFASYRAGLSEDAMSPEDLDDMFSRYLDMLEQQFTVPFAFAPYHRQMRTPIDYYAFGVDFLRPLVDKARSSVGGLDHLERAAGQLSVGENVIFFANHQTEGDPQAISLLLEDHFPDIGRDMIFVAGDRVLSDPLAIPFSMGRNLLCIYSKRHIDHPPDQRLRKQLHNRRTMEVMRLLLSEGAKCLYVAPSGGRDRPNAEGIVDVAPFDDRSVEVFYLIARRAARRSHFYPMALSTYDLLPPPETVQIELGESRNIKRSGIHLAVGSELDMDRFPGSDLSQQRDRRDARGRHVWQQVQCAYARLTA